MSRDQYESFRGLRVHAQRERIAYLGQLVRLAASQIARLPASFALSLGQVVEPIRTISYARRRQ